MYPINPAITYTKTRSCIARGAYLSTFLCLVALQTPAHAAATKPSITAAEFAHEASNTILNIEFPGSVKYKVFTLSEPNRVVIDFEGIDLNTVLKELPSKLTEPNATISGIRVGQPTPKIARVVLDVNGELPAVKSSLHPTSKDGRRLTVQLPTEAKMPASRTSIVTAANISAETAANTNTIMPVPVPQEQPATTPKESNVVAVSYWCKTPHNCPHRIIGKDSSFLPTKLTFPKELWNKAITYLTAPEKSQESDNTALAEGDAPGNTLDEADNGKHGVSFLLGVTSDYIWRGVSQTHRTPALQPEIDYDLPLSENTAFFAGVMASNIKYPGYPKAKVELIPWIGITHNLGNGFSATLEEDYYEYPQEQKLSYGEISITLTKEFEAPLKPELSLRQFIARNTYGTGTDNFYTVATVKLSLPKEFGFVAHYGHSIYEKEIADKNYNDWKVGVTKEIAGNDLELAYYDSTARQYGHDADAHLVLTATHHF